MFFSGGVDETKDGFNLPKRQCSALGVGGLNLCASYCADGLWSCEVLASASMGQTKAGTNGESQPGRKIHTDFACNS